MTAHEREDLALRLFLEGWSYRRIGEHGGVGVTKPTVCAERVRQHVWRAMRRHAIAAGYPNIVPWPQEWVDAWRKAWRIA